jgi:glycosyltransferase involved in cell wall biosynthesis
MVPAGPRTEVPKDELLPYMDELGDRLAAAWEVSRPDLVHAHFWMSGLASVRATRGTGVPVAQTFHALGSVKRRQQGLADTSPRNRVALERRLCHEVDHVIATCTDEVAELQALGLPPARATIIPCGVDTEEFRPGPRRDPDGPPRLLVLGRLVTRKGVGNVVEALAQLPGAELVVAGGPAPDVMDADPAVERLRSLAERFGVSDRVRFLGGVARSEVPGLIRDSDVVVAVPWYEPFGIVPLEAMACGRPVVAAAVGGMLDTVVPGVTGEHVTPRDPAALAATLRGLLDDPDRRKAYGTAGRDRAVELYDWNTIVDSTEAAYEAVVAARSRTTTEVAR